MKKIIAFAIVTNPCGKDPRELSLIQHPEYYLKEALLRLSKKGILMVDKALWSILEHEEEALEDRMIIIISEPDPAISSYPGRWHADSAEAAIELAAFLEPKRSMYIGTRTLTEEIIRACDEIVCLQKSNSLPYDQKLVLPKEFKLFEDLDPGFIPGKPGGRTFVNTALLKAA